MLVVNGFWIASGVPCVIINVYSSCYLADKLRMWDVIKSVSLQNSEECVCVVGDFNAIKEESERVGRAEFTDQRGIRLFQEFIDQSMLIDLPLCGRSYTWYRPDGSCKSRLDRLLVNDQWLHTWPNASLKGMRRSVSDHCPIFTDFGKKNWGPKPFRFFNSWLSHEGLGSFVAEKWSSYNTSGWAGFVLKEKLKMLKEDLKVWNQQKFRILEASIEKKRNEVLIQDTIDDVLGLESEEIYRRAHIMDALAKDLQRLDSQLYQKARIKWIAEGDANTRFFHNTINRNYKINEISGLSDGTSWVDSVQGVKSLVFNHFRSQFNWSSSF
ncbi:hypothetical protein ACS0TY_018084 [Phlomoides rotata]